MDKNLSINTELSNGVKIYTVTEITRAVKAILEDSLKPVWVEGEVSNLRTPLSGHMYFTLKDEYSSLNCVMFKRSNSSLRFKLEDGLKAVVYGKISVYEKSGQYQLYAESIEPKGLGSLQLAFEQLKKRLSAEGLFSPEHKKPIPDLPRVIGIVTSPTGAAVRDILNILERRFKNLHVLINPVRVQGDGAAEEIANAIIEFNKIGALSGAKVPVPDVLIVTRGGGSIEDLWEFNEEVVARAVYDSTIPVISAVGHEIDWTIIDFVADLRAPTPSAAAELVVEHKDYLKEKLGSYLSRLDGFVASYMDCLRDNIHSLSRRIQLCEPINMIVQKQQRIDELLRQLNTSISHKLDRSVMEFKKFVWGLENLSPLNILKRGYSITFKSGGAVSLKDTSQLNIGDNIKTKLSKGEVLSEVKEVRND